MLVHRAQQVLHRALVGGKFRTGVVVYKFSVRKVRAQLGYDAAQLLVIIRGSQRRGIIFSGARLHRQVDRVMLKAASERARVLALILGREDGRRHSHGQSGDLLRLLVGAYVVDDDR